MLSPIERSLQLIPTFCNNYVSNHYKFAHYEDISDLIYHRFFDWMLER
jgi:hypothetical protein